LSVITEVAHGHIREAHRCRKDENPTFCHWNFDPTCRTFGYITTSGLGDHIAISDQPSMSHLFAYSFFELVVIENFSLAARTTKMLTLEAVGYFAYVI